MNKQNRPNRLVVLDTETTGLSPNDGHRIIEIGCVEIIGTRVTGNTFHAFVDPERDVPDESVKIHGLRYEDVLELSDGRNFSSVAGELLAFIKDATLVIHNAPFDTRFLNAELERAGRDKIESAVDGIFDTLKYANQKDAGKKNGLDAICKRYGIDNSERTVHGALLDARLTAEVYLALTADQHDLSLGSASIGGTELPGSGSMDIDRIPVEKGHSLPLIKVSSCDAKADRDYFEPSGP